MRKRRFFNGRPSPKIESARKLSDEETAAEMPFLVAVSKYDPATMKAELLDYAGKISNEALRGTVIYALNERETFFTSTAAVKCTTHTCMDC